MVPLPVWPWFGKVEAALREKMWHSNVGPKREWRQRQTQEKLAFLASFVFPILFENHIVESQE